MARYACVNKGPQITVYNSTNTNKQKIGDIYTNEAYVVIGEEGWFYCIKFNNPSGNVVTGYLIDPSTSQTEKMYDYPFEKGVVGNIYQHIFKMRRSETILNRNGDAIGSVPAGRKVCANPNSCGQDNPTFCEVYYTEAANGTWQNLPGGNTYGFLDMGLDNGSFSNTISMYGAW